MTTDAQLEDTDIVVIGAGIYGCATAYFLSQFGKEVVVVDSADVGGAASGANAGNLHLQLSPFSHADKSLEWVAQFAKMLPFFLEAHALWRRLGDELDCDIELRRTGGIMVGETEHQIHLLRDKVELERSQGLQVEMLEGNELRARAPYLSEHIQAASYCPDEGMANALTAVVGLADGARNAGTRFLLQTRVERLESEAGRWRVWTSRGPIKCRKLVIATGSCSGEVGAMAGVHVPIVNRVIQIVATEACEAFIEHLVYHSEVRLTLKQAANGNIIIGGGWSATRDAVFGFPAVLNESLRGNLSVARAVVPRLAEACVIRSWAGPNVYTPDGYPILGPVPGREGLSLAVCNTYGFTLGPLCGLLVAETAVGRPVSADMSPFSIGRFPVAP